MSISLIAAIDESQGLGKDNELLCHMPADLKYFKQITLNKTIVMGRKTYDSIGKPLPKRTNIVVSRNTRLFIPGVTITSSLENALSLSSSDETMIIGGASIYAQAIELADKLYITKIHHQFNADAFFPNISLDEWKITSIESHNKDEKNPYDYDFITYERGNS